MLRNIVDPRTFRDEYIFSEKDVHKLNEAELRDLMRGLKVRVRAIGTIELQPQQRAPGPGAYKLPSALSTTIAPKWAPSGPDTFHDTPLLAPGPGQYDTRPRTGGQKSSIAGRLKDPTSGQNPRNPVPGPNAYSPWRPLGHDTPKISLSFRPRSSGVQNHGVLDISPGPAAYTPKSTFTFTGGNADCTPRRQTTNYHYPGPQTYCTDRQLPRLPKQRHTK